MHTFSQNLLKITSVIIIVLAISYIVHSHEAPNDCNILLLSGGGSYGAYEAGVIARLVEKGTRWDYISGVSAGSINAFFLSGIGYEKNLTAIFRETWSDIKTSNVYEFKFSELYRSLVDNSPLRKTLHTIVDEFQLNTLKIPVYIGAVSMSKGVFEEFRLDGDDVKSNIELIISSGSVPIVFPMNMFNGDYYVDGGTLRNIIIEAPILECLQRGKTNINVDMIVLRGAVTNVAIDKLKNMSILGYAERIISILYQNIGDVELNCEYTTNLYARRYQPPDLPYSFLDFNYGQLLFDMGYRNTTFVPTKLC